MLVDFIGKQTMYPARYGHMGQSEHIVVVQRLISARPLTRRGNTEHGRP